MRLEGIIGHWLAGEWSDPLTPEEVLNAVRTEERLTMFSRQGRQRIGISPTKLVSELLYQKQKQQPHTYTRVT